MTVIEIEALVKQAIKDIFESEEVQLEVVLQREGTCTIFWFKICNLLGLNLDVDCFKPMKFEKLVEWLQDRLSLGSGQ